jgi:hypothetical protein
MKTLNRIFYMFALSVAAFPLFAIPLRIYMYSRVWNEPGNDDGRDVFYSTFIFLGIGFAGLILVGISYMIGTGSKEPENKKNENGA